MCSTLLYDKLNYTCILIVLTYDLLKNRHIDDITITNMTNLPTYHMVCTEMGLKMNVFSADVILNPLTN